MRYEFPMLSHLAEVRAVVGDVEGFIIAEREWGWVANYVQMGNTTFPEVRSREDAIRRECRGLIFSPDGQLVSRPYHKFFNLGERTETLPENLDLAQHHVILEKLDGSMIRPIPLGGSYRLGTKMGITEVAMQAEVFVAIHPNYDKFIRSCLASGCTPIFEWCSRKQRIVIDYPEDRLVLTAVRNNLMGTYMGIHGLRGLAESFDLDLVKEYEGTTSNMEALMEETRDLKGQEGWIIRFDDGHMLKLKAAEYVIVHKAKDNILRERGVIEMMLEEKADDIKAFLPDDDRKRLEAYETAFWHGINLTAWRWGLMNVRAHAENDDRKTFALEMAPSFEQNMRAAIFKAWDSYPKEPDWRETVLDAVRKNLSTQAKIDAARHLWGEAIWSMKEIDE